MNSTVLIPKRKKQYNLSDLVIRSDEKEIDRIYDRAAKKADKMQKNMLKQASRIK
jgi:hypothetical protein